MDFGDSFDATRDFLRELNGKPWLRARIEDDPGPAGLLKRMDRAHNPGLSDFLMPKDTPPTGLERAVQEEKNVGKGDNGKCKPISRGGNAMNFHNPTLCTRSSNSK